METYDPAVEDGSVDQVAGQQRGERRARNLRRSGWTLTMDVEPEHVLLCSVGPVRQSFVALGAVVSRPRSSSIAPLHRTSRR